MHSMCTFADWELSVVYKTRAVPSRLTVRLVTTRARYEASKTPLSITSPKVSSHLAVRKGSISIDSSVNGYTFSEHPEIAAAIGRQVAEWTEIECALAEVRATLLRAPAWLVVAAYGAIVNNSARIGVNRACTLNVVGATRFKRVLVEGLDDAQRLFHRRNGYVYKPWVLWKGHAYQQKVSANVLDVRKRRVLAKEILEATLETLEFRHRINEAPSCVSC